MDFLDNPYRFAAIAWIVIGATLCAVELLAPGAFFIWFGFAAALVGVADFFVPMYLKTQLLLFGGLVAAVVLVGRLVDGSRSAAPGAPPSRARALIGQDFFLDEPIVRGFGQIRVGDSSWRVAGPDSPVGTKVRVIAVVDGSLLNVERVEANGAPPPA
jgi:inner membrane protein